MGGRRDKAADQAHRAFVESAGRGAVRAALDAAVLWIGGARIDSGELERLRVRPRAVMVGVDEKGGSVAGDRVEVGGLRGAAGEVGLVPAAAEDPRCRRVLSGVLADLGLVRRESVERGEVAVRALDAALDGVDVRVDETREKQSALQVDDLGTAALPQVRADRGDPAGLDRHREARPVRGPVEDGSVHEQGVHAHDLSQYGIRTFWPYRMMTSTLYRLNRHEITCQCRNCQAG